MDICKDDIWIDPRQGVTKDGRPFGFVGCNIPGGYDHYCGWFFEWPHTGGIGVYSVDDINYVLNSMEADPASGDWPIIPLPLAKQELEKYLRDSFDL